MYKRQYQRYSEYFEAQLLTTLDAHAAAAPRPPEAVTRDPRPRILVCAPSNAATDELLSRVLCDKFVDVHGQKYAPHVARVGSDSAALSSELQNVRRQPPFPAFITSQPPVRSSCSSCVDLAPLGVSSRCCKWGNVAWSSWVR